MITHSLPQHGASGLLQPKDPNIKPTHHPFHFCMEPHIFSTRLPSLCSHPHSPLPDMTSVQDHAPVVKEFSERHQQDPQPTSETPRDPSPPQLHDPQPDATESNPSRRTTTATNPSTLVNQPGTDGSNMGPASSSGGAQNVSATQDRIHQPHLFRSG